MATFTTNRVLESNQPILEVYHDHNGDWQLLCGTTNDIADARIICPGSMFEMDRSIEHLADMPTGWRAWRRISKPSGREPRMSGSASDTSSLRLTHRELVKACAALERRQKTRVVENETWYNGNIMPQAQI